MKSSKDLRINKNINNIVSKDVLVYGSEKEVA